MSASVVSPAESPAAWLQALEELSGPDVYFHPAYCRLYAGDGAAAEAFVYREDGDVFLFPYVRRPIPTRPGRWDLETAYGYGGPLASSADAGFVARAWSRFQEVCRGGGVVAGLIRFHPLLDNQRFADPGRMEVSFQRETVSRSLGISEEEIWAGYEPNTRNKVRRCIREGIQVRRAAGEGALDAFRKIYESTMDHDAAEDFYYFSNDYFRSLLNDLPEPSVLYLANRGGEVIAGALVLVSRRFVHMHLSGTLEGFRRLSPASLMRHAVICDWRGSGREKIHFGGGRSNAPDDALFRFKKGFSPEREKFFIGRCVLDREEYDSLCGEWAAANPEKIARFGGYFLRYRH